MSAVLELGLKLPEAGSRHVRRELHEQLRAAILCGRLAAGVQLPASRALAGDLGLSRNTVTAVYDLLLSEGLIASRPGAGTFVATAARTTTARREAQPPIRYDLRPGLPDSSSFPFDIWGRLTGRALRRFARASSGYREPAGHPALREAIAGHLSFARAIACDAEDIVVTVGAQQAFDLIARTMKPGAVVVVEDPGYPAARAAFAAAGAEVRAVPVDAKGLVVDALPRDATVVCVTPSQQFPLGMAMSEARRAALLAFAAERGAVIVEDDYGGEFRFGGSSSPPLFARGDGRVAYVGTFSQSLLPALRIGFVVAPPGLRTALAEARALSDWHGPAIEHATLAAFIAEGHLARHVRRMRKVYAARRAALLAALGRHVDLLDVVPGAAGLHVAVLLRGGDAKAVAARAAASGLKLETLASFAAERPAPAGFALGYGLIEADEIDAATATLVEAISKA
jgi:GntR family transcriptional regulator / MocR family aminotransferase